MRGKRLPLLWLVGKGWGVHTRGLTVRAGEGEGMEPAVLGADGVGEEWAPAAEVLNAGGRDESQTRCRGSQARPLGVGRVGRFVAGGPGGPQDRGLCLGQGGCPFPTQKRSSPLAGWGFLFSEFLTSARAPALLSLGLAAAVTLCVGLTEGFLGLFGPCCYGCQLQGLAGWEAGQEGGVMRACHLGGGSGASPFGAGVL